MSVRHGTSDAPKPLVSVDDYGLESQDALPIHVLRLEARNRYLLGICKQFTDSDRILVQWLIDHEAEKYLPGLLDLMKALRLYLKATYLGAALLATMAWLIVTDLFSCEVCP